MSLPLETTSQRLLAPGAAAAVGPHNQLSTLNGCFVPCLLTILGAVLFLRVGFSVGMMGLWGALGILCFAEFVSYLTVSSFSAIVSNGRTQGGGAYFLIARNLGPAFGGSSGLLFWVSYCINATYNVVAWTEIFQSTFLSPDSWWGKTDNWSQATISTISYFPLFLVAYKGAGTFAQVNAWIFAGLFIASVVATGSLFFYWTDINLPGHEGGAWTYTGFNLETLQDNFWPDPKVSDQCASAAAFGMGKTKDQVCSLQNVFAIIFPAVIGMMEGLNLSGDLKEPERSIPKGTLWAVSVAFALYALLLVGQAGTMSRAALQYDMKAMQHATVGGGYFVVLGVATACLSTVLGSLFGAARILQAMARDEVLPGLGVFKFGTDFGDEPRTAVIASYILGQFFVLLGNLDDISPLLTNFFLMTYVLTDLAAFLLEFSKVPNFRPKFRYYSWQTSLLNCILVLFTMFYLSVVYAICTLFAVIALFVFITWRFSGRTDWIDIRQAFLFRFARHGLQAMTGARKDFKYWRPSLLLLAPDLSRQLPGGMYGTYQHLIIFLNQLKQKGLLVVGQVLLGEQMPDAIAPTSTPPSSSSQLENGTDLSPNEMRQKLLTDSIPDFGGFVQVSVASNGRLGCSNLMLGAGLGSLSPDTVVLALPRPTEAYAMFSHLDQFVDVLSDTLHLKHNLMVAANFDAQESHMPRPDRYNIDMWIFGDLHAPPLMFWKSADVQTTIPACPIAIAQISFLLQVGFLAHSTSMASRPKPNLRFFHACNADKAEASEALLQSWLLWARIPAIESEVFTMKMPGSQAATKEDGEDVDLGLDLGPAKDLMLKRSSDASLIVTLLPHPHAVGSSSSTYVQQLRELTDGLPRTLLLMNGQGTPVITTNM